MPGLLLDTLRGTQGRQRPIWLMRQAGRYLPEYRALRASKGGFLALVYDSEAAAEITLQPIRRFGFDGAILFSDILIVPYAMGQDLEFLVGEGPRLSPRLVDVSLASLKAVPERLKPIYETVKQVRAGLGSDRTLLGFAGSPWTVATYMVAGEGSRDQHETRAMAYRDPQAFQAIIDAITDVTVEYLLGQIQAGAEAVQLFDSWAGSLAPAEFERWVIAPNAAIVARLKRHASHTPVIGFPKGAGEQLPGSTWEILEKTLARSIFEQTGVEIADGPIPFTDQTFVGKDGFDTIVQFFICKHKYGVAQIQDPNKVAEIAWQAFAEFDAAEFEPLVYTVFEKATQFMEKLHTL